MNVNDRTSRLLTGEQYDRAPVHVRDFIDIVVERLRADEDWLGDGYGHLDDCWLIERTRGMAMEIIDLASRLGWHVNTDEYEARRAASVPEGTE